MTKPLTKQEAAWVKKLQKVLDECPSERLGFYTIGDPTMWVYDKSLDKEIAEHQEKRDGEFSTSVIAVGADLTMIEFPSNVHSVAG